MTCTLPENRSQHSHVNTKSGTKEPPLELQWQTHSVPMPFTAFSGKHELQMGLYYSIPVLVGRYIYLQTIQNSTYIYLILYEIGVSLRYCTNIVWFIQHVDNGSHIYGPMVRALQGVLAVEGIFVLGVLDFA